MRQDEIGGEYSTHVGNENCLQNFGQLNKTQTNEKKITAFWDIAIALMEAVAPLKRRSTSTTLYDAISQKAVIFILAAVRT
jgi:hypothetical protein